MTQQVNSGFLQSPIHQQKIPSLSETSFSDSASSPMAEIKSQQDAPVSRPTNIASGHSIPLVSNGQIPQLQPALASSPSSIPSTTSSTSEPKSPPQLNSTINIPLQLYQYLQQMAMMNPTMAALQMPNHNLPYVQAQPMGLPQVAATGPDQNGLAVPKPQPTKLQDKTTQPSQIYEEIPSYKMYAETPQLPAPRQQSAQPDKGDSSTDSLLLANTFRKKANPLYGESGETDSSTHRSEPSSSAPLFPQQSIEKRQRCNRCLCVGFLIMTTISCASLILTLLIFTEALTIQKDTVLVTSSQPPAAEPSLENSINVTELLSSYQAALNNQTENLHTKIELLQQKLNNLTYSQAEQQQGIMALADRLPTGIIDTNRCVQTHRNSVSDEEQDTRLTTDWVPVNSQLEDGYVLVGAACTHDNYRNIQLKTEETSDKTVYQCQCSGIVDTSLQEKRCTINYWICPIVT